MSIVGSMSFQNMYREYLKYFSMNKDFKTNKRNLQKFKDYFTNRSEKKSKSIEENVETFATITEIDPEFYSIVNNKMAWSADSKSDMNEVKASSLLHLKTGYINDEILKSKHNFALEMQLFKILCQQQNKFVESFERFLIEDYQSSESILQKSKEKSASLQAKTNICKELKMQIGTAKHKIDALMSKCKYADIYRTFLYQVSPLSLLPQTSGCEMDREELETSEIDHKAFVTKLKKKINDEEAQLPFTEPQQLITLLENIETQNLTSWMNAEIRSENRENIKINAEEIKDAVHLEFNDVEELLQNVSDIIDWENMRSQELKKKINQILEGILRITLCSDDYFKLNICLDDIFNKLIYKDISFEMQSLMTIIENEYEANVKMLDCINLESAKFVEKQRYKDDLKTMQQAQEAAKKLKMLESLNYYMKKSLVQAKVENN